MFDHAHNIKHEGRCAGLAGVWKSPSIIGVAGNQSAD